MKYLLTSRGRLALREHQFEAWFQPIVDPRTREIVSAIPELAQTSVGLLHVFIQHTSASLTINENADPDVPQDLESSFLAIAPEDFPYRHTCEGPDDMPAHIKAALTPVSISIPVVGGRPALGTWQGLYLWEHRTTPHTRKVTVSVIGE